MGEKEKKEESKTSLQARTVAARAFLSKSLFNSPRFVTASDKYPMILSNGYAIVFLYKDLPDVIESGMDKQIDAQKYEKMMPEFTTPLLLYPSLDSIAELKRSVGSTRWRQAENRLLVIQQAKDKLFAVFDAALIERTLRVLGCNVTTTMHMTQSKPDAKDTVLVIKSEYGIAIIKNRIGHGKIPTW